MKSSEVSRGKLYVWEPRDTPREKRDRVKVRLTHIFKVEGKPRWLATIYEPLTREGDRDPKEVNTNRLATGRIVPLRDIRKRERGETL